jgi:hypothetical protein
LSYQFPVVGSFHIIVLSLEFFGDNDRNIGRLRIFLFWCLVFSDGDVLSARVVVLDNYCLALRFFMLLILRFTRLGRPSSSALAFVVSVLLGCFCLNLGFILALFIPPTAFHSIRNGKPSRDSLEFIGYRSVYFELWTNP